jgi:3-hydroxybenzoate/4-hydroxybenzoate---CoA ligase
VRSRLPILVRGSAWRNALYLSCHRLREVCLNAAEFLIGSSALSRHAERLALICGEHSVTFKELAASVTQAASAYARLGLRPGDRVLLLLQDTPEFAAAWLGALRMGGVAIALNNKLSEAEYRHILADSAARVAIVEDVFADARPDLTEELARDGRLVIAGSERRGIPSWRRLVRDAGAVPAYEASPDSPAFYLYSSGTTGRPKGMLHTHRSVLAVGASLRRLGIAPGDRVFATSKLFFAYGLEHGLLAPLALGATAVLCPDWPDADTAAAIVAKHRPKALFGVPTVYRRLLAGTSEQLAALSSVKYFIAGGERLSRQLVNQWERATKGGELLSLYGMSETFCVCMLTAPGTSDGLRAGEPMPGVEVRLVDAGGNLSPDGEPGILWVKHPALAAGYVNLVEKTAEQFRDGWFCTRDMFMRDAEGYFVHLGRSDELVKIAGQWVQPSELEEAVATDEAIAEAACLPFPDADGLERLALFIATRGDPKHALRAAADACDRLLPRHKRPKWLRVVDHLPRTATGKVQRFKLREMLAEEEAPER